MQKPNQKFPLFPLFPLLPLFPFLPLFPLKCIPLYSFIPLPSLSSGTVVFLYCLIINILYNLLYPFYLYISISSYLYCMCLYYYLLYRGYGSLFLILLQRIAPNISTIKINLQFQISSNYYYKYSKVFIYSQVGQSRLAP